MNTRSSSPSLSSPTRSRSSSISSLSAPSERPDSQSDFSDEDERAPKKSAKARGKRPAEEEAFDPKSLSLAQCQWGDCREQFWELEPMIEHLTTVHAFPNNPQDASSKRALVYACDWIGCPRRGKPQGSKAALIGHFKSHTGEKPFDCPRPECDKSFTRLDALQKHLRIQHGETILPSRRPPTKKKKGGKGAASDSDAPDEGSVAGGEDEDEGEQWTEEELRLFDQHPEKSRGFVAYVLLRAKWTAAMGEAEGLASEAEALGLRESELKAQVDELLSRIMRKECLSSAENDPAERLQLDRFLTNYSHEPFKLPAGFTAS